MSFFNDGDDDFGVPSSNSKLSSLFRDTLSLPSDNKALTYTAPKRPVNHQQQQLKQVSSTTEPGVLAAAAVTCYKLNNEKYEALQGKVGLALLGNREKHYYTLILYIDKQKPLSTSRVTKDFKFISQPDNFCTFYDDSRQNWAVLFDSSEATNGFGSEVEKVLTFLNGGPITNKEAAISSSSVRSEPEVTPDSPSNAEESSKTKLISRMAKLGQPILPLKGAAVAEDSDSDTAVPSSTETEQEKLENVKPKKPSRAEKPFTQRPLPQPVNEPSLANPILLPTSNYSFVGSQHSVPMLPYAGPSLTYTAAPAAGSYVNYYETLLSETRTQNSEIRMHLCRLMDKIDYLAQKKESSSSDMSEFKSNFCKLLGQSSQQTEQLSELLSRVTISKSADAKDEIKKSALEDSLNEKFSIERESLKSTVKKLKEENDQLASLLQNKVQEQEIASLRMKQFEDENAKLRDSLNCALSEQSELQKNNYEEEIEKLQLSLNEQKSENQRLAVQHENELRDIKAKLTSTSDIANSLRTQLEESTHRFEIARQERTSAEKALSHANQQIEKLNEELIRIKEEKINRAESGSQVIDQVKAIMNKVYKEITKQFTPEETYSFKGIKSTVGAVIRDTTLKMLNEENDQMTEDQTIKKPVDFKPVNRNAEKTDGASGETRNVLGKNLSPEKELPPEPQKSATKEIPEPPQLDADVVEKTVDATRDDIEEKILDHANEEEDSLAESKHSSVDHENDGKEQTESFEETLQTSLVAAYNRADPVWKPAPPPLPPIRDFDDDEQDDWLA